MAAFIECRYNGLAQDSGVDFMSVKGKPDGSSELVINPNTFSELNAFLEKNWGATITEQVLRDTCVSCGLCTPTIRRDGEGFRIDRKGYSPSYDTEEKPLFETIILPPEVSDDNSRRICIVDDIPSHLGEILAHNHHVLMVNVDANVKPTLSSELALRTTIEAFRPEWVVSDKGLGNLNGIRLIEDVKRSGRRTIMFTGEIQTDETRRVADVFIEKPHYQDVVTVIEND